LYGNVYPSIYWEIQDPELRDFFIAALMHTNNRGICTAAYQVLGLCLGLSNEKTLEAHFWLTGLDQTTLKRFSSFDAINLTRDHGIVVAQVGSFSVFETGVRYEFRLDARRPSVTEWEKLRVAVFARDDYTCSYCGVRGAPLECDHVVPVSRGGNHGEDNLVASCRSCNRSKRDKTPEEWRQ